MLRASLEIIQRGVFLFPAVRSPNRTNLKPAVWEGGDGMDPASDLASDHKCRSMSVQSAWTVPDRYLSLIDQGGNEGYAPVNIDRAE